ncbi:MAG: hypothetical protein A3F72_19665 [Bacteroidetes bacterium RIFCSPLOWO2_12_FULL_35_15]|nr:MAG: hypothetical protein A3F72_19665 [Bacteroidetes bacterium RIFCSPLOWO2_12_FULL_35_15]
MNENDKILYDILWYLNEYPNEINSTEDEIRKSLKITKFDYDNAKSDLLKKNYIQQRIENKNNLAFEITTDGNIEFNKLKNKELSKIQSNVEDMGKTTLRLTWVLAISASIASLYYLFELLKEIFHMAFR